MVVFAALLPALPAMADAHPGGAFLRYFVNAMSASENSQILVTHTNNRGYFGRKGTYSL